MKAAYYLIACLTYVIPLDPGIAALVGSQAGLTLCASGQGNGNGNGNIGVNNGNGNSGTNNGNFNRGNNNGNGNGNNNNGDFKHRGEPPSTDPQFWLDRARADFFFRLRPDNLRSGLLQLHWPKSPD